VLLALGKAGCLDVLRQCPGFHWHIGPIARGELKSAETRDPVESMILEGVIAPTDLDSDDSRATALFAEWCAVVDPGEAESIAIGLSRDWGVALEDRAAQRHLDSDSGPGRWINCADVLIDAVKGGRMSLAEADAMFRRLDVYSGYATRGVTSLRQVAPGL
jgi:hypothetical protein